MADISAVTRIDISATDSTQAAQASVASGLSKLGTMGAAVTSQFQALAATLGVGFSVAGITDYTTHVIAAAEELHKLATVTGSSVEDLSRLSNAAKISGVDFDTFRGLTEKLASQMQGIGDTATKAQKALQFLGVSAKDPAQALQEVAVALDRYADGAGKAAIARDLFARGGPEIVAALHAMATAGNDLVTTTTADSEAAAHLNEQVRTLQVQMNGLKDTILRAVVPALSGWISGVEAARAAGLSWFSALNVGTTYADRIGPSIDIARTKLDALTASYKAAAQSWNAEMAGGNFVNQFADQVQQATLKLNALKAIQLQYANALISPSNADARDLALANLNNKAQLNYSGDNGAKSALDAFIKSLVEQHAQLTLSDEDFKIFQANLLGAKGRADELIKSNLALAAARKTLADVDAFEIDQSAKELNIVARQIEAHDTYLKTLQDQTKGLQIQVETIGMSADAAAQYTQIMKIKEAADIGDTDAVAELTKQMDLLQQKAAGDAMVQAAKDAEQAWKHAAEQIDHDLADMFSNVLFNGKSAFDDLKRYAEDLFKKLVLQPALQPIAGQIATAFSGAGGSGGLGSIGSLLNVGSVFGSLGAGGVGPPTASLLSIPGVSAEALAAFGEAIPYVGIAIAGAALLSGAFKKSPSQVQGTFSISGGTGGFEDNAFTASRFGNIGFADQGTQQFSGQAGQVLNKVVADTLAAFATRLSATQQTSLASTLQGTSFGTLSGTFTTEDFLQKYGGDILKQVVSAAFDQLDPALSSVIKSFSGTADEVAAMGNALLSFEDASKRIPDIIKTNLIGAFDGTIATAQKITAFATAYSSLVDVMNADPLADALKAIAGASDAAFSALENQRQALAALGEAYTGTTEQSTALQAATVGYYNALVSELATIENLKRSISQSDTGIKNALTLQTLDTTGKYGLYQSDAAAAEVKLAAASTPADVKALHDQILSDIQSAFGLLTPEQQQSMLSQFTAGVDRIDQEATNRLTALEGTIQSNANDTLTQLRGIMDNTATSFAASVGVFSNAAANIPPQIDVNVDVTGPANVLVDTPR